MSRRKTKPTPPAPKTRKKAGLIVHVDDTGYVGSTQLQDTIWPELASKQTSEVAAAFGAAAHPSGRKTEATVSRASDLPQSTPGGYINLATNEIELFQPSRPIRRSNTLPEPAVRCWRCGQSVRQSQMRMHLRDAHNATNSTEKQKPKEVAPKNSPTTMPVNEEVLVQCPYCPSKVKPSNYDRHIAKVHPDKGTLEGKSANPAVSPIALALEKALAQKSDRGPGTQARSAIAEQPGLAKGKTDQSVPQSPARDASQDNASALQQSPNVTFSAPVPVRISDDNARKGKRSLVPCPYCKAHVRFDVMDRHILAMHPELRLGPDGDIDAVVEEMRLLLPPARRANTNQAAQQTATPHEMTTCPTCGVPVRLDRLERHIRKVHKAHLRSTPQQGRLRPLSSGADLPPAPKRASRQVRVHLEDLEQAYYEERDGGKYLGFLQRERSGRFGSLPLYDGYDDEDGA